jgi:hypothetical protein
MLESLPAVLLMGHHGFDYHYPLAEVHDGDEAVLVIADVENQDPGCRCVIRAPERLFHFHERGPCGGSGDGQKTSWACCRMFCRIRASVTDVSACAL